MKIDLKLPDVPRKVATALGLLVGSGVLFGALFFTIGVQRDDAIAENSRLQTTIAQTRRDTTQAVEDVKFVNENLQRFEALIQGERLVPHTRRDAGRRIQAAAVARGLTVLSYDFNAAPANSAVAVTSQAQGTNYRVNLEGISMKLGSPLDGQIYKFLLDLRSEFPGAAILQSLELQRAPAVTSVMLDQISRGADAGLVQGEAKLIWRTAQSNDPAKKP